ncbi:galectin-8 [Nilaparvata lugens]|uniref:galectin-8 n=1 Tax=Nilaparvata lugens TaxID=108931 RepID=UPI00193CE45A|nr:galectin-8 [Nilaparvata lugens]XP_039284999.1 galectin-8 [Nilaparvata lugens]XP_039285000.1 galectin-8 [Nilaparvata lugens]
MVMKVLLPITTLKSEKKMNGLCIIRFTVNICRIISKQLDIGFHFNPRFDQQYIARNSKIDGKWGIEEAQSYCRFPFSRGDKFCVEIFATHNEFMVAVNGLHYCAFSYRYPLFDLNRIEIFGNLTLQKIVCVSSKIYPSELSNTLLPKSHFLSISNCRTKSLSSDPLDCVTPLVISLDNKISAGTEIEIIGRVKLLPHSFYVNLQRGKLNCPHPVINLHVNARFREKPNRGCCTILSNSWISDEWGSEQFASRDSYFFAGQHFRLTIKCQDEAFLLSNNGNTIMAFTHRADYSRVNTILIVGDIFVQSVTLQ